MKNFVGRLLAGLTALLAVFCLAALAGRWHWLPDLFAHFVPHYLAAGSLLFPGLVLTRRYPWAALALVATLWNGWLLLPYAPGQRAAPVRDATSLEVLQFNISRNNPVPLAAIGYLMSLDKPPDVVVLLETTPSLARDIKRLNRIYPTIAQMPRNDNFGIAVLSRLPESEIEFRDPEQFGTPLMVLNARLDDDLIRLYAVHPPPPLGGLLTDARNAQLRGLATEISRDGSRHVIVAGDLNTTVWSRAFTPLVETAGLRDAQRGHGYLPTWAPPPASQWIGIPIDLTLVSARIEVEDRHAGPWLASDHWPVHTRLILR